MKDKRLATRLLASHKKEAARFKAAEAKRDVAQHDMDECASLMAELAALSAKYGYYIVGDELVEAESQTDNLLSDSVDNMSDAVDALRDHLHAYGTHALQVSDEESVDRR